MDKYSRYYGIVVFLIIVLAAGIFGYMSFKKEYDRLNSVTSALEQKEQEYNNKLEQKKIVERKLAQLKSAATSAGKKIYAPLDADLGNDTLFFTLYSDLIEMIHSNSIKIKSMEYVYNPENDAFVKFSKDMYFVCEVNMELVSNYSQLGKFIQEVVQYPYYIRILDIDVKPYDKDKKILITNASVRLYARTTPEIKLDEDESSESPKEETTSGIGAELEDVE
jgi:Tfp pilus assembly protein PilO